MPISLQRNLRLKTRCTCAMELPHVALLIEGGTRRNVVDAAILRQSIVPVSIYWSA
ncbi:MAG: hypothetical protein LH481_04950 [Burkholderiales bacterium]|nr:hypothetical protein [Burkholderiales bacterium]